jgi:hypothetical protein
VHVRRALLLFALVLGLAALAAAVSQPRQTGDQKAPRQAPGGPTATPVPAPLGPASIGFSEGANTRTRRLQVGRPAVVTVEVSEPGQVEIAGLGLSSTAEPLTPARFDVLSSRPGRYAVRFTAAGSSETRTVGTLYLMAS